MADRRTALLPAAPPVHARPARVDPRIGGFDRGGPPSARPAADTRPAAEPHHAAAGMRVPSALPVRHGPLLGLESRGLRPVAGGAGAPVGLLAARGCGGHRDGARARAAAGRRGRPRCRPARDRTGERRCMRAAQARAEARHERSRTSCCRLDDVVKHFPMRQGSIVRREVGRVHAVDGVSLDRAPRRDARPRRRDRLRQVDAGPLHHPAVRPDQRPRRLRRHGHLPAAAASAAPVPPRAADDLPGSVRIAEPAPPGRLDHRRPVRDPRRRRRRGAQAAGAGADGARRTQPGALQPLPGRVLRRPAAAHRRRPRPRAAAQADRLRRAGVGARRLDPGAGHQPAHRSAAASSASPTSSSPTTCPSSGTSATASR